MRLLLVPLLLTLATLATGQTTVCIPDSFPSSTVRNGVPLSFPQDFRFQVHVPATFLPSNRVKITEVAVACETAGTWSAQRLRVRVGASLTPFGRALDQNLGPTPVTLRDGPASINFQPRQWVGLGLDGSFAYDGTVSPKPSLVIELCIENHPGGFILYYASNLGLRRAYNTNCQSSTAETVDGGGPKICLTVDDQCVLTATPSATLGGTITTDVTNAPVGETYQIAASWGDGPFFVAGNQTVGLRLDELLKASLIGSPVFTGYRGTVPANGSYSGTATVPQIPMLAGLNVYHAAVMFTNQVTCSTNTASTLITP